MQMPQRFFHTVAVLFDIGIIDDVAIHFHRAGGRTFIFIIHECNATFHNNSARGIAIEYFRNRLAQFAIDQQ